MGSSEDQQKVAVSSIAGSRRPLLPPEQVPEDDFLQSRRISVSKKQSQATYMYAPSREARREGLAFGQIVGNSPELLHALELARRAALSDANVLVFGESGTGKELVARAIHATSSRAAYPFVEIDCASIPEALLESELFGYEPGAFTGASRAKPGLFEIAEGGSLFLDEVGELPLHLQPKLLRVLQQRRYRRLGGTAMVAFDARVISATNRELGAMVKRGDFREDLFYRLHVIPLSLPALRDRPGDVRLLAERFLRVFTQGRERPMRFDRDALEVFEKYAWPGNVRELRNAIEHACALTEGDTIMVDDLPRNLSISRAVVGETPRSEASPELPLRSWMREHEKSYLISLLEAYPRNISRAAKAAGVDRKTLRLMIEKHGLR